MIIRVLAVLFLFCNSTWAQQEPAIDSLVEATFEASQDNRPELEKALSSIEPEMKPGMRFLLAYMPKSDARVLRSEFLLEHVRGAYAAWNGAPWKTQINEETFFNYILPYANVSERREAWRQDFRERFLPLVESAKSPSEAAVILNQKIFPALGVKYSTKRKRADQGPYESIEGGTASCTGLSILLIDACRSVGVPARFVGIPRWSDNSGNHSWVEIWDGEWKFTGAAEPTGDELNKGWFTERASSATESKRDYAIYAVSYRKTGMSFPMVWKSGFDPVWALNVTSRYAKEALYRHDQMLLRFKAINRETGDRVIAKVAIVDATGQVLFEGETRDERFDANDHMPAIVPKGGELKARFVIDGRHAEINLGSPEPKQLFVLQLPSEQSMSLTREEAIELGDEIWEKRKDSLAKSRRTEMENKRIKLSAFPDLEMKYEFKVFGDKPKTGHALFISMHGGGGAPPRVNESQWRNQIGLYEPDEGIYLAPRAPTDTWNLWHQKHIDSFFDRIIENSVATGMVDPNRVYLMGYSTGGDGVYQLAPRMADRFAAASMMAGHPNETKPLGLRNLPFALFMGGKDSAYDRNKIASQWKEKLEALKQADPEGYDHQVTIYPEKGHWMDREDAAALTWMAKRTREPWPKKIVWHQDDVTHERFYWLSVPKGKEKERTTITATVEGQKISIESENVNSVRIWLNDKLIDLDQEIQVIVNGKSQAHQPNRSEAALESSLDSRFDRDLMSPAFIDVTIAD